MNVETVIGALYLAGFAITMCLWWYRLAQAYARKGKCTWEPSDLCAIFAAACWPIWSLVLALVLFSTGVPWLLLKSGIVTSDKNGGE